VCAAIRDHAFSKGAVPDALESRVLQDADRLDANRRDRPRADVGDVRGHEAPFYAPEDPFCESREPDDKAWGLDHVFKKLLVVPSRLSFATRRACSPNGGSRSSGPISNSFVRRIT
jgi:uncharacterized protein